MRPAPASRTYKENDNGNPCFFAGRVGAQYVMTPFASSRAAMAVVFPDGVPSARPRMDFAAFVVVLLL